MFSNCIDTNEYFKRLHYFFTEADSSSFRQLNPTAHGERITDDLQSAGKACGPKIVIISLKSGNVDYLSVFKRLFDTIQANQGLSKSEWKMNGPVTSPMPFTTFHTILKTEKQFEPTETLEILKNIETGQSEEPEQRLKPEMPSTHNNEKQSINTGGYQMYQTNYRGNGRIGTRKKIFYCRISTELITKT